MREGVGGPLRNDDRPRPVLHQFLAAAAPHDAVTNQALALQDELRARGVKSAIVAEHVHDSLSTHVERLRPDRVPRGPVLLRYSIWSKAAQAALDSATSLGVIYHNITPPDLVARSNPAIAALCSRARRELPRIIESSDLLIADSTFNADELRGLGARDVRVVPLLLDITWCPISQDAPRENVLFASEMVGAVNGIDPETGHAYDDTKRYVEAAAIPDADRAKIYAGNALRAYPRLAERLRSVGVTP